MQFDVFSEQYLRKNEPENVIWCYVVFCEKTGLAQNLVAANPHQPDWLLGPIIESMRGSWRNFG